MFDSGIGINRFFGTCCCQNLPFCLGFDIIGFDIIGFDIIGFDIIGFDIIGFGIRTIVH
jgi:hypothetical protein